MRGAYINFYLMLNISKQTTEDYLRQLLRYIECCYRVILSYPKALEYYLIVCNYMAKELSELLFSIGTNELVMLYCNMFTINYKLSERLLREQRNGNSKNDKNLDKTLETMNYCLIYIRNALMYVHKTTNLANA
jgi:hypothetical protein